MSISNNPLSLGKVTVTSAGTPVQVTAGYAGTSDYLTLRASMVEVHALGANTNNLYVGYSDMNRTTLANVLAILGPGETWSLSADGSSNVFDVSKFYLDADTNSNAALAVVYVK